MKYGHTLGRAFAIMLRANCPLDWQITLLEGSEIGCSIPHAGGDRILGLIDVASDQMPTEP